MNNQIEHRGEDRVSVELPVRLGQISGLTHDVSASGICFEVDASYAPQSDISIVVELDTAIEKMILKCKGTLLRTTDHGPKKTVVVKITESHMETAH